MSHLRQQATPHKGTSLSKMCRSASGRNSFDVDLELNLEIFERGGGCAKKKKSDQKEGGATPNPPLNPPMIPSHWIPSSDLVIESSDGDKLKMLGGCTFLHTYVQEFQTNECSCRSNLNVKNGAKVNVKDIGLWDLLTIGFKI